MFLVGLAFPWDSFWKELHQELKNIGSKRVNRTPSKDANWLKKIPKIWFSVSVCRLCTFVWLFCNCLMQQKYIKNWFKWQLLRGQPCWFTLYHRRAEKSWPDSWRNRCLCQHGPRSQFHDIIETQTATSARHCDQRAEPKDTGMACACQC